MSKSKSASAPRAGATVLWVPPLEIRGGDHRRLHPEAAANESIERHYRDLLRAFEVDNGGHRCWRAPADVEDPGERERYVGLLAERDAARFRWLARYRRDAELPTPGDVLDWLEGPERQGCVGESWIIAQLRTHSAARRALGQVPDYRPILRRVERRAEMLAMRLALAGRPLLQDGEIDDLDEAISFVNKVRAWAENAHAATRVERMPGQATPDGGVWSEMLSLNTIAARLGMGAKKAKCYLTNLGCLRNVGPQDWRVRLDLLEEVDRRRIDQEQLPQEVADRAQHVKARQSAAK